MKPFLLKVWYEKCDSDWNWKVAEGTFLVNAKNYERACETIRVELTNVERIDNLTFTDTDFS